MDELDDAARSRRCSTTRASTDPDAVRRLVFCSGKVAYDALARRDKTGAPAAVVRVEQLFPFPQEQLLDVLERYPNAKELVWLQEEPENMGPWHFMFHRAHRSGAGLHAARVARVGVGQPGHRARPRSTTRSSTSLLDALRHRSADRSLAGLGHCPARVGRERPDSSSAEG